jgi:amidohydrolase
MRPSPRSAALLASISAPTAVAEDLAQGLYECPEVGLEEHRAVTWMGEVLESAGFAWQRGIADLATAFAADWGDREARPVIAFLAEYDALPGLGHACGHNLIAGAAVLAAIALTQTIASSEARVRVIGCPAEETYGGKAQLVAKGVFAEVDVAMMAHGHHQHLSARPASGRKSVVIEFHGREAHASVAPDKAINALDAMLLTFSSMALMRQQLREEARVHGIITHGGTAANIVPGYTRAECYVRSFDEDYLDELECRLIACARGAAEATGARLEVSSAALPMLPVKANRALEERYQEHLLSLGEVTGSPDLSKGAGSTDFGNVSRVVPGIHAYFRISDSPVGAHTVEFAEAAGSETGHQGMVVAATAMALTALDLVEDPTFLPQVRDVFARTT